VLPNGIGARIDPSSWERPAVYRWLDGRGVPEDEQRRVFNLGIGFCAVVPAAEAEAAGFPVIGRLEEGIAGVVWADA
jgi:phosphoribosylformylglycinamidine cyclo-ligase